MTSRQATLDRYARQCPSQQPKWVCVQEPSGTGPHGQSASDKKGRADRASGCSPQAASHQLPHAQEYMLLHALSQQLEAGHVDHVLTQIKEELEPQFLEHHPDLLFELQRCECCPLSELADSACGLADPLAVACCAVSCCADSAECTVHMCTKTACLRAVLQCAVLRLLALRAVSSHVSKGLDARMAQMLAKSNVTICWSPAECKLSHWCGQQIGHLCCKTCAALQGTAQWPAVPL